MRKKSHISLAGQIMDSMELDNVFDYRLPFYVGSIWPDCRPSFVTTPHKFDITFDDIERKISKFIANYDKDKGKKMLGFLKHYKTKKKGVSILSSIRMGVVLHYIADYFTFPHNDHYPGNVKDHCYYERDLKFGMRAFLQTEEAAQIKEHVAAYDSVEELTSYIRSIHNSYMKLAHTVEEDIRYIVHACTTVVKSVLNMVSYAVGTSVMNIQYV